VLAEPFAGYHDEVVEALAALGNPRRGEAVRLNRRSELHYLGAGFPEVRRRVEQGFTFSALPPAEVLSVWDALWKGSQYGEVLFAALEYCAPLAKRGAEPALWPVVRHWIPRVDNWAHADSLAGVYSFLLASKHDEVYPQLEEWNRAADQWMRRISIVSLIHYTGKNAVFLSPGEVLPLVTNCLDDHRHYVELAVGWVLREMGSIYPTEITRYLESHAATMTAPALSRAIERQPLGERNRIRAIRESMIASGRSPAP
jgi:3-methyladenine DNA glycosylase AlkD